MSMQTDLQEIAKDIDAVYEAGAEAIAATKPGEIKDGGIIFSDYAENIVGVKAFDVISIDKENLTIELDSVDGIEIGYVYTLDGNYINGVNGGTIQAINGNVLTVDTIPEVIDESKSWGLWFIDHPELGTQQWNYNSIATGRQTKALGHGSLTEGRKTITNGDWAHAEGHTTEAWYCAHAEGVKSKAKGQGSHAEGVESISTGYGSHSEGYRTEAAKQGSHSEGYGTKALNDYTHAEGYMGQATGKASHIEGGQSTTGHHEAKGDYGHAEGIDNMAEGYASHVEGQNNKASGTAAHAGGTNCSTGRTAQFAHGSNLKLINWQTSDAAAAFGKFNDGSSPAIFMVGNGTKDNERSNAFEVFADGHAEVQVQGETDNSIVTKQYLDQTTLKKIVQDIDEGETIRSTIIEQDHEKISFIGIAQEPMDQDEHGNYIYDEPYEVGKLEINLQDLSLELEGKYNSWRTPFAFKHDLPDISDRMPYEGSMGYHHDPEDPFSTVYSSHWSYQNDDKVVKIGGGWSHSKSGYSDYHDFAFTHEGMEYRDKEGQTLWTLNGSGFTVEDQHLNLTTLITEHNNLLAQVQELTARIEALEGGGAE